MPWQCPSLESGKTSPQVTSAPHGQRIGDSRRKRPQHDIDHETAADPFPVRFHCQQKSRHTDGEHADQRDLGRFQRIGDGKYRRKQCHQQGERVFTKTSWRNAGYYLRPVVPGPPHRACGRNRSPAVQPGRPGQPPHFPMPWQCCSLHRFMARMSLDDTVAGRGYRVSGVLQCLHQQTLLPGCHSAKYRIAKCRLLQPLLLSAGFRIHIFVRVVNARQLGDLGKPSGIISGNDLHGHLLGFEIKQRFSSHSSAADWRESRIPPGNFSRQRSVAIYRRTGRQQKHPISFLR